MRNLAVLRTFTGSKPGNIWLFAAIGFITLLRLSFTGLMDLMPQDAYYYFYGQHLALSYFDHPPAIAWILRGFTDLLGRHAFVIKLADTVVTALTLYCFYLLAQCFLSRHRAISAWLLLYSTLMITLLSLVSTPDVPLLLFWTLSLLSLYKAVFTGSRAAWVAAGVAMGLAFDSKYTGILLPAGTLLFLLLSKEHRRYLWSPWLLVSILCFFLTISPVVIWNVQNGFASFRFQSSGRLGGVELHILDFFGVIGHQAAVLMPVLLFALFFFLYRMVRKYGLHLLRMPADKLFLLCFFVPLFVGFLLISPVYWVKLNWMMPAYITGIIWVGTWLGMPYIRWQWICSLFVHLALAAEILFYPVPIHSDDTMIGWKGLGKAAQAIRTAYPNDFIFSADDYKTSAILNFYLGELVYSRNILGENALQFDYIGTDIQNLKGRNAIFINSLTDVNDDVDEQRSAKELLSFFRLVEPLPPVIVRQGSRVVRKFLVFRCMDYHPPGKETAVSMP